MKLLQKIFVLCLWITIGVFPCRAQGYITTYIPEYLDSYIITKIIDSLEREKITNFIVYQTNVESKVVIDSLLNKNDTIAVSFLIYEDKGKISSYIITDTVVYRSMNLVEDKEGIFGYQFFDQLWLREDENNKIVPPINEPYDKDIVVYITPVYKRFFELGNNTYYQLKKERIIEKNMSFY